MVVDRTGGGKSLILQLASIMVAGNVLVIIPLLALTANQIEKIKHAMQQYGRVDVTHLDETEEDIVSSSVIPRMLSLQSNTTTTNFLLCSPQYVADNSSFREALLECHRRHTLRLVAIDEIHLYTMHGRSFRDCIRHLNDCFFSIVFRQGVWHPLFLAMTATMTLSLIQSFSTLTSVDWSLPTRQLWSSAFEFRQRYIYMGLQVTGDIGQVSYPMLLSHLAANPSSYAAIFVNFKSECVKWAEVLEEQLAEKAMTIDVLQINGDMDKDEKFAYIRLFTGDLKMKDYFCRILLATAAANTGIDQEFLDFVIRVGLPRCLTTLLQERGRNARRMGMVGRYIVFSSWILFLKLLLTILIPRNNNNDAEPTEAVSVNTFITSRSPDKRQSTTANRDRCPLTATQKYNNIVSAFNDLIKVLSIYFLPGLGCVHCRVEWYMARGVLEPYPEVMLPCNSQCYVCDAGRRDKNGKAKPQYILPIIYQGALDFLASKRVGDKLPFELDHENGGELIDLLDNNWLLRIFGKVSVNKYNVSSFWFQLIATGIVTFEWKGKDKLLCVLARDDSDRFLYEDILRWEGFLFRSSKYGRGVRVHDVTFKEILCNTVDATNTS